MIELEVIRQQLDFERRTLAPEGCVLEAVPYISRLRCGDPERDMITFSSLTDDTADIVIAEQAAHYRDLATQVEWKVYQHDSPRISCNALSDTALRSARVKLCSSWICRAIRAGSTSHTVAALLALKVKTSWIGTVSRRKRFLVKIIGPPLVNYSLA
jgi:hypothetical protein